MPEPGFATLIAAERTGLALRRDGAPFEFTGPQGELMRRGFELLVMEGLQDDGYDVVGQDPVRVRLERTGPGDYELLSTMHDARPLHRRLFSPLRQETIERRAGDLRQAVDTVLAAALMLPMILGASSVTLGTQPDGAGLVPMITDGRNVMRVPWSIFRIMGSSPRAQAGANSFKHLLEQDDATITLIQGLDTGSRRSEAAMVLAPGLWEQVADRDVISIFDRIERCEDPLPGLMTQAQREQPTHGLRSQVGPRRNGMRADPPMPPPGPRI